MILSEIFSVCKACPTPYVLDVHSASFTFHRKGLLHRIFFLETVDKTFVRTVPIAISLNGNNDNAGGRSNLQLFSFDIKSCCSCGKTKLFFRPHCFLLALIPAGNTPKAVMAWSEKLLT